MESRGTYEGRTDETPSTGTNPTGAPGRAPGEALDPRAAAVADRLRAANRRQSRRIVASVLARSVRSRLSGGRGSVSGGDDGRLWMRDKLDAMDPTKAQICYVTARTLGARRVVEAGTGFGYSTIHLAAAIRDNVAEGAGAAGVTPAVFGTEFEPRKAAAARANLAEAGLGDPVTVLEGDLRETLPTVDGPIDMMVLDVWIDMAAPALTATLDALRPGAVVLANNVVVAAAQYAEYLALVRDPNGPFRSSTLPLRGGMEVSVRR